MKKEKLDKKYKGNVLNVVSNDVIETIIQNKGKGKIGVLNFASARNPGGGFLKGASAQEEAISRVSDLYLYLKEMDTFYKNRKHFENGLYDSDIIYSSDVSIIKNTRGNLLNNFIDVDIITSCAVNVGDLRNKKLNTLLKEVDRNMIERIENILEVAIRNDIDILILGAFGCGVFGNSGYKVKDYFEVVINKARYKNKFKEIIFAIYERPQDNNKLLNIFNGIRT